MAQGAPSSPPTHLQGSMQGPQKLDQWVLMRQSGHTMPYPGARNAYPQSEMGTENVKGAGHVQQERERARSQLSRHGWGHGAEEQHEDR